MTEKKYLEYEKQFSGIDREEFINLLISKGATKIKDERIIRSTIFFHPLGHKDSYIRIRDEGDKIVMTSKNNLNKEFVNEYEVTIDNYDAGIEVYRSLGCVPKYSIEKTRETWSFLEFSSKNEIVIDGYPGLPSIFEVECESVDLLNEIIILLDLVDKSFTRITDLYKKKYNLKMNKSKNYSEELTFKKMINRPFLKKNDKKFRDILRKQLVSHNEYCRSNGISFDWSNFPSEVQNYIIDQNSKIESESEEKSQISNDSCHEFIQSKKYDKSNQKKINDNILNMDLGSTIEKLPEDFELSLTNLGI